MPYLPKEKKKEIETDGHIDILSEKIDCAGDINYVITRLIQNYVKKKGLRYENLNSVVGALESCKLEFYRRVVSPYENLKAKENGDVMEEAIKEVVSGWY
jgi:hypothetical protein